MNQKSLLETIHENIRNGELPDSFSLPKEDSDPNKVKWADGAYDGVSIFHMGRPEITDEHMKIVADAFSAIQDHERAKARMKSFFAKISPLWGIDAIQNYIFSHTDSLPAAAVHQFAMDCIQSSDVDLVKLGMLIIEIFSEPDNTIKDIIRTLGLNDEFTIFAVFNMLTWQNANEEVFALVKKVHGWGRIHAIERLSPDAQEIKDWLLAEGIRNNVVPAYSALEVFRKADVSALLQSKITDTQLDQTAGVFVRHV